MNLSLRQFGWAVVSLSTFLLGGNSSSTPAKSSPQLQEGATSGAKKSMDDMQQKVGTGDAPAVSGEEKGKMDEMSKMMDQMKGKQPGAGGAPPK